MQNQEVGYFDRWSPSQATYLNTQASFPPKIHVFAHFWISQQRRAPKMMFQFMGQSWLKHLDIYWMDLPSDLVWMKSSDFGDCPDVFLRHHHHCFDVHVCGFEWNVLNFEFWIAKKSGRDIHDLLTMNTLLSFTVKFNQYFGFWSNTHKTFPPALAVLWFSADL